MSVYSPGFDSRLSISWLLLPSLVVAGAGPVHLGAPKSLVAVASGMIGDIMPVLSLLGSVILDVSG
jgi:hypothetical protein